MTPDEQFLKKLKRIDEQSVALVRDFIVTEIHTGNTMADLAQTEFRLGEEKRAVIVRSKAALALEQGLKWLDQGEQKGLQLDDLREDLMLLEAKLREFPVSTAPVKPGAE